MSAYEYKTVALPSTLNARPKRRQSEADLVAETFGTALVEEAVEGWEYMRADTLTLASRGWFSRAERETRYTVLVFRRAREAAWRSSDRDAGERPMPEEHMHERAARPAPAAPVPKRSPLAPMRPARPANKPAPAPVTSVTGARGEADRAPVATIDDISGTVNYHASGEFVAQTHDLSQGDRRPPISPRPPLGSARD